uniref:Uncharacterized protein n=1 Tax=Fagus sylvatica TaxID=28930 RepID=A0A2N9ILP3_FAGSY
MVSDVMDNTIRLPYSWLLGWDHGSKLSVAPDISDFCSSFL